MVLGLIGQVLEVGFGSLPQTIVTMNTFWSCQENVLILMALGSDQVLRSSVALPVPRTCPARPLNLQAASPTAWVPGGTDLLYLLMFYIACTIIRFVLLVILAPRIVGMTQMQACYHRLYHACNRGHVVPLSPRQAFGQVHREHPITMKLQGTSHTPAEGNLTDAEDEDDLTSEASRCVCVCVCVCVAWERVVFGKQAFFARVRDLEVRMPYSRTRGWTLGRVQMGRMGRKEFFCGAPLQTTTWTCCAQGVCAYLTQATTPSSGGLTEPLPMQKGNSLFLVTSF